ncbi:MAG: preprotein translocase subunit SecG [Flavobacteriia bacterium]|nr:preprotein translocase subunit SecG [Flavobacteriia bacterium]OJX36225.1 MAG: preprotein translocase subunit SecG [Flavobacteriia bacterium 40-80]
MSTLISILIILASILLVVLVFVQNPKGGGLSSDFGVANQLGGVQKTNDFVDKATWSLAGIIAVCSIVLTVYLTPKVEKAPAAANQEQAEVPSGDLPDAE